MLDIGFQSSWGRVSGVLEDGEGVPGTRVTRCA